ncbi:hypothetical protein ANN_10767 [Periplaneta americana]|uniref:Reverse transcriptase domain-containing protein n=1 Tax=Periplaneta americana TaxID=6978 RepID=A0ABQ8T362_PERAM|nr:hypothetical protein ANN_10767 [Periplaneta americana]
MNWRNGEWEKSSLRRRYEMLDNIKRSGSYEETKRKAKMGNTGECWKHVGSFEQRSRKESYGQGSTSGGPSRIHASTIPEVWRRMEISKDNMKDLLEAFTSAGIPSYLVVDETTDIKYRKVVNVLVAPLGVVNEKPRLLKTKLLKTAMLMLQFPSGKLKVSLPLMFQLKKYQHMQQWYMEKICFQILPYPSGRNIPPRCLSWGREEQMEVVIDFAKAFDVVPHEKRLEKLSRLPVDVGVLRWIYKFLENRTQKAKWEFYEEVHCLAENGSTRRAEVIAIDRRNQRSFILDHTVRFEKDDQQANNVNEYAVRNVQDNRESFELNGLHQLLVYADYVNMLGANPQTIRENVGILLEANKAIGLKVNPEKTKRGGKIKYLAATITDINDTWEKIKRRINMGNACYYTVENLLSSSLLSNNLKVRIYKTVVLPVVLYGCETWTLTLREEQSLRVFENKVLRKIFGARRDKVTGEWRKLHNAELDALYFSPDIIRNVKSRRLISVGHVAHIGESRNVYSVLGEAGGEETFGEAETYMGG